MQARVGAAVRLDKTRCAVAIVRSPGELRRGLRPKGGDALAAPVSES
jgi:hypothetical protein